LRGGGVQAGRIQVGWQQVAVVLFGLCQGQLLEEEQAVSRQIEKDPQR
jgi:hypothetical protein